MRSLACPSETGQERPRGGHPPDGVPVGLNTGGLMLRSVGKRGRPLPPLVVVYLFGVSTAVGLSIVLPSLGVSYSFWGAVVGIAALVGLMNGSNICRWILIVFGILSPLVVLAVQSDPVSATSVGWSALVLLLTGLLVVPSVRRYTE